MYTCKLQHELRVTLFQCEHSHDGWISDLGGSQWRLARAGVGSQTGRPWRLYAVACLGTKTVVRVSAGRGHSDRYKAEHANAKAAVSAGPPFLVPVPIGEPHHTSDWPANDACEIDSTDDRVAFDDDDWNAGSCFQLFNLVSEDPGLFD